MRLASKGATAAAVALMSATALAVPPSASSQELDGTGGTLGPVATISTRGTGGTAYRFVPAVPQPSPAAHKPPSTAPRRSVRDGSAPHRQAPRKPTKHKPTPRKPPAPQRVPAPAPEPAPAPVPSPGTPAEALPGVPTPAQTAAEGAVFPVSGPHSFGGPENRFGAGRTGHLHQGQDVLAAEGLPDVAPMAGTIVTTGYQAGAAGWYVAEHTSGAFDFFFAHCQAGSIAVQSGQSVTAGQTLCSVGMTGDATGPHLHFEMWVGGWRASGGAPIDPLPYLEAWERG